MLFYIIKIIVFPKFVFSENLQLYIVLWPCCKHRYCRIQFTSSFIRHVDITNCRKMKTTILGKSSMAKSPWQISSKSVQRFSSWIMRTGMNSPTWVHFMHIVQRTHNNALWYGSSKQPAPAISFVPLCPSLPATSFHVLLTASHGYPVTRLPAPEGP
jgi:hypothetical protein